MQACFFLHIVMSDKNTATVTLDLTSFPLVFLEQSFQVLLGYDFPLVFIEFTKNDIHILT